MLPDDVFRAQRDRTVAALRQWHSSLSDCALCEEETTDSFWRLAVMPFARGACPVEVVLHGRQTYDIAIGPESYENRPGDELERLPNMAEAISAGRILTRTWISAVTGLTLAVESEIHLSDGEIWKAERWLVPHPPGRAISKDKWYLPYRR